MSLRQLHVLLWKDFAITAMELPGAPSPSDRLAEAHLIHHVFAHDVRALVKAVSLMVHASDGNCINHLFRGVGAAFNSEVGLDWVSKLTNAAVVAALVDYAASGAAVPMEHLSLLQRFVDLARVRGALQTLDINAVQASGCTPLATVAARGDFLGTYLLLRNGADPRVKSVFTDGDQSCKLGARDYVIAACNRSCRCFSIGCKHEIVLDVLRVFQIK